MNKFIIMMICIFTLNACQSPSTKKSTAGLPDTKHTSTGLMAPGQIDDFNLVNMMDYSDISNSSAISYKNKQSKISVYFRDKDITLESYYDVTKQAMSSLYKVDSILFEGEITYTINDIEYVASVFRGVDSSVYDVDPELTLGNIRSTVIFSHDDYIIKIRHTNFAILGTDLNATAHNLNTEAEQLILETLLKTL